MASAETETFFGKEQLMKRMLCVLLILCALPVCLFSCKREDPFDFPETVETLYPIVEGRRVPFKYLFTAKVKNAGECFILRSVKDVQRGFKQEFLSTMGMQEEIEELLLGIDYDKYQVLGLSVSTKSMPDLVELIDQDGTICTVYEHQDPVWEEEKLPATDYNDSFDFRTYTVVILARKSDFDLSHINRTFSANADQYLCYPNEPERVERMYIWLS